MILSHDPAIFLPALFFAVTFLVLYIGSVNAVIHNVGVGYREPRHETADGLEHVFAVNVLAPYVLTALIARPERLVYLSSGMHYGGDPDTSDLQWQARRWNGSQAYSDSKLFDVVLAFAVSRLWPDVLSNAVEPGWVATRMGGEDRRRTDGARQPVRTSSVVITIAAFKLR